MLEKIYSLFIYIKEFKRVKLKSAKQAREESLKIEEYTEITELNEIRVDIDFAISRGETFIWRGELVYPKTSNILTKLGYKIEFVKAYENYIYIKW